MPQPLSSKEAAVFRQLVRNYEDKQYRRAVKSADLILKKNPRHGDTMAMKALTINSQGKTDEAFLLAKEALTVDMKSHICWHVYGLLYRAAKNYEEAIKAYKFALKLEPESQQIQRDLAVLQAQTRDYIGYIQTRSAMLQARPHARQNWTALAAAHHIAGNLSQAEHVLTTYESTVKIAPSRHDLEHSEAIMYKNSLIAEQGDFDRALDHLESDGRLNLDRLAVLEHRAEYLAKLGRIEEAAVAYRALIDRNPDHMAYYIALNQFIQSSKDDLPERKALFEGLAEKYPHSDAARRMPLELLTGDAFRESCKSYLALMFNKGIPSTFSNLKHLYLDVEKKDVIEALVLDYLEQSSETATSENSNDDESEQLKGRAAVLFYLTQHYNYRPSRNLSKAMGYVKQALEMKPTNVDIHMAKARILKHLGNLREAAEVMDHARSLDLRDRYINSKAAKYRLRNNQTEKAIEIVGLFTKGDTTGGPLADLMEMQCIWFLTEDGESHERQGHVGLALKRFHGVHDAFEVWQEDQLDFHAFSLRKGQLRAYIGMIRWEDQLRAHPMYSRAALDAIKLYLKIHDNHDGDSNRANGVENSNHQDAASRRKAAKKVRKEQQRLEKEATGSALTHNADDPLGLLLATTSEPLSEAMRFLSNVLQYSPKCLDAQIAGFDVYIRRHKYLLALRCLKAALQLDASHPNVHEQVVKFQLTLRAATAGGTVEGQDGKLWDPKTASVISSEASTIHDLGEFNEAFYKQHSSSLSHVLSAIRVRRVLGLHLAQCEAQLMDTLQMPGLDFVDALAVLDTLVEWKSGQVEKFRQAACEKWPDVVRLTERRS